MSKPLNGVIRAIKNSTKSILLATSCLLLCTINASAISAPAAATPISASEASQPALFDAVTSRAKLLSRSEYKAIVTHIPEALAKMDYDQYRSIRFRSDAAIWHNESPFEIQLFHAGFLYKEPVVLHMATNGEDSTVQFKQEFFNYDGKAAPLAGIAPKDIGFAGFRIHYPLNNNQYKDEFAVFQGSSYFRIVGPGQAYGLSARGLAIDTAEPKGEEFPVFREFWMMKPTPAEKHMVMYALLDSPSITGAYRFDIYPGSPTEIRIQARIFARKDILKVGIAPLTSMYMFGENSIRDFDDFRPEVHDSDGLLMQASSGEWVWRPLSNHRGLHVSSLGDTNPRGFGVLQRDRDFNNYLDTEAKYERRPSLWVKPENNWGKGRVELVEIPSDSEANDNIVAYWVPEQAMKAGDSREFNYRLRSFDADLPEQTVAKVIRTRTGWGAVAAQGNPPPKSKRQFAIDFRGGELDKLPQDAALMAELQKNSGNITDLRVSKLPDGKTWRASFKLEPEGNNVVDMRLFIKLRDKRLTEVWSYVWYPDAIQ
ncbi:MAG: glucan biosynthesis protein G [Pseudomonadota bacterium]